MADEVKVERTIAILGRLLRDDKKLQVEHFHQMQKIMKMDKDSDEYLKVAVEEDSDDEAEKGQ